MIDAHMQEALRRVEERFAEIETLLAEPGVASDPRKLRDLSKERARLEETVRKSAEYRALAGTIADDEAAVASGDAELAELANAELPELRERETVLVEQLKKLLLPRDPDDDKNVIVEIRAGTGGDEAALFAGDLYKMLTRYAAERGYSTEVLSQSAAEQGGFKDVTFEVRGAGAYSVYKYEGGTHRVQRVPETESQGRIHTSTATVAVLPEAEEVEVDIDQNDLQIDVYRSSGPGGQSVNTTDSAVRITHQPTGIVVSMQDEKSQLQNREKAMRVLRARLYERQLAEQQAAVAAERKAQVGTGERSEKIRTYNCPQGRVTDHRIKLTAHDLDGIMNGNLNQFTDALAAEEKRQRLEAQAV